MRGWATEECGGRWLAGVSGAAGGGGAGQRVRQGGVPLVHGVYGGFDLRQVGFSQLGSVLFTVESIDYPLVLWP